MRISLLLALLAVPAAAQTSNPPVVLINGYQVAPCENVSIDATFNQLAQRLRDTGREVIPFNNCSVPAPAGSTRPSIEDMAAALGARIAASSAPQVDVVVHSMGGLILRAYLAGKQRSSGTFLPPSAHKVRKAVFLATPHFGPGLAPLLVTFGGTDPQVRQLLPGSQFLYELGTWNQGADDLRGVDTISVIGSVQNAGDGLVLVPSAANPVAPVERTRVVPYCHTDIGLLALAASACARPPYIANINSDDHLSWRIIRSFLAGTTEWRTLGTSLSDDPVGSRSAGLMFVLKDKNDAVVPDLTRVAAGPNALQKVAEYFYGETLPAGVQLITATTAAGASNISFSLDPGTYSIATVKPSPNAAAVLPAAGRVATRSLAPGMFVSIYGAGLASSSNAAASLPLPTTLSATQVLAGATPLGLQFAGPSQINAILPENASGVLTLNVRGNDGLSRLNIFIEPAVPAIFTQTGTGSGPASALNAISGMVITAQSPARPGDVVSLYLTGLGATETRDGLQWARNVPKVFVGGIEAQVHYAGRAPGFAGLDQINFTIPPNATGGSTTEIRVESAGRVSNAATLPLL